MQYQKKKFGEIWRQNLQTSLRDWQSEHRELIRKITHAEWGPRPGASSLLASFPLAYFGVGASSGDCRDDAHHEKILRNLEELLVRNALLLVDALATVAIKRIRAFHGSSWDSLVTCVITAASALVVTSKESSAVLVLYLCMDISITTLSAKTP